MATPIQQALQQVGNQIVAQMKANLQRNNNDNTGRLSNSIQATVEGDKLIITMEKYGKWVNNGAERRAGRKPPIKAIQFWIAKNAITPRGNITAKQLPFAIARGIGKKGVVDKRAFPFIIPAANKTIAQFETIVGPAIIKDFQQTIKVR